MNATELETLAKNMSRGDLVWVTLDRGERVPDRVLCKPSLLGGHTWVVWLEHRKAYLLERCALVTDPIEFARFFVDEFVVKVGFVALTEALAYAIGESNLDEATKNQAVSYISLAGSLIEKDENDTTTI